jgi:hypothetical protein
MNKILAATLVLASACASDDGTAPTISTLTYSPNTATHGVTLTVTGSFMFTDEDGDLAELGGGITLPDQTKMTLAKTNIRAIGDQTSGSLGFQLQVTPPVAGAYGFQLFVTDESDNVSNRLDGTITAN